MSAHDKGIDHAQEMIFRVVHGEYSIDADAAGCIIRAYLEASGQVLVPKRIEPAMLAAAWGAWQLRHGGKLGPGPAFVEAINAAVAAAPQPFSQDKT